MKHRTTTDMRLCPNPDEYIRTSHIRARCEVDFAVATQYLANCDNIKTILSKYNGDFYSIQCYADMAVAKKILLFAVRFQIVVCIKICIKNVSIQT